MKIAWISETGKREDNQDSCVIFSQPNKPEVAIVADGMGGHAGGSTASRIAVETVYRRCMNDETFDIVWLREVVSEANTLIRKTAAEQPSLNGMGTTLVICVICGDEVLVANVGDSRLYLFDGVSAEQITVDHSYVQELVSWHVITREEARIHPKRNIILRAVGTDTTVEPDIFTKKWKKDDILLLSTDGLHDSVTDGELAEVLLLPVSLQQRLEMLVEKALMQGSTDNITAVACANDREATL